MASGRAIPDFNDEDFDTNDLVAHQRAVKQRMIEHMVAAEEMVELQKQISECYWREGVNHVKNCRPLTEEYAKRLTKWRAYVPPEGEETDSVVRMRS